MREGTALFAGDLPIGTVTSGGYGPSVGAPIAMGYVAADTDVTEITGEVRGKRLPATLCPLPFTPTSYKR
jgi:aminomethyltransferase